jgi:hypothetical protein
MLCCAVLCSTCSFPAPVLDAGVGGWAESGANPAEYSRMLMRVACAYIEGADVRAVSSLDSWQSSPSTPPHTRTDVPPAPPPHQPLHPSADLPCCAPPVLLSCACVGVGGWAESGVNPAEYSRMLMRVACAYIEGADVRAVSSLDSWQSTPCASLSSVDLGSISSADGGSSSDGSSSGRDPAAAVAVVNPRKALDTAHKFTKLPGSATACVVQLCPEEKQLVAASLVSQG